MYFEHVHGVTLTRALVYHEVTSSRLVGLSQASKLLLHVSSSSVKIILNANTSKRALMFPHPNAATTATPFIPLRCHLTMKLLMAEADGLVGILPVLCRAINYHSGT